MTIPQVYPPFFLNSSDWEFVYPSPRAVADMSSSITTGMLTWGWVLTVLANIFF